MRFRFVDESNSDVSDDIRLGPSQSSHCGGFKVKSAHKIGQKRENTVTYFLRTKVMFEFSERM